MASRLSELEESWLVQRDTIHAISETVWACMWPCVVAVLPRFQSVEIAGMEEGTISLTLQGTGVLQCNVGQCRTWVLAWLYHHHCFCVVSTPCVYHSFGSDTPKQYPGLGAPLGNSQNNPHLYPFNVRPISITHKVPITQVSHQIIWIPSPWPLPFLPVTEPAPMQQRCQNMWCECLYIFRWEVVRRGTLKPATRTCSCQTVGSRPTPMCSTACWGASSCAVLLELVENLYPCYLPICFASQGL